MALIPLEEILKKVSNVYEAVLISAKEARHINERRLAEQALMSDEEESDEEETVGGEEAQFSNGIEEEKVTIEALKKLVDGRIEFMYESEKE